MRQRYRRGYTAAEKTELWDRWQRGESLKAIEWLMSALGQKRTSSALGIYVRYWGQSGHWYGADAESQSECPLSGVKRTFASYLLNVCL